MSDRLREQFDTMYDGFVQKQSRFVRGAVESKREDIWDQFNILVRPYYEDALSWRAFQQKMAQDKRMDHLAGGSFE